MADAAPPAPSGPNKDDVGGLVDFIHQQTGLPKPKNPPPINLESIDDLTKRGTNSTTMYPGQNVHGFYDGDKIHLINVWDRKNPQDQATLLRELTRSMMSGTNPPTPAAAERLASKVQEAWMNKTGNTFAGLGLSRGNLTEEPTRKEEQAYLDAHSRSRNTGGLVPHMADGGLPRVDPPPPFAFRQAAGEVFHPQGLINSGTAGRTDRIPVSVASDSYVIPADVVSGLGQGNTLAGAKVLDHILKSGPWGTTPPHSGGHSTMPHPPSLAQPGRQPASPFADGGKTDKGVKIIAAGGEYIVGPHTVQHHPDLGGGDMKTGHDALDAFVKMRRAHNIKELKKLPGPKKN